mgnify:CR=1 FL=1
MSRQSQNTLVDVVQTIILNKNFRRSSRGKQILVFFLQRKLFIFLRFPKVEKFYSGTKPTSPSVVLIIKIECSSSSILFNKLCKRKPCSSVVKTNTGCERVKRIGSQFQIVKNYEIKVGFFR